MDENDNNLQDYLNKKKYDLAELINDPKLINYFYQASAKKIGATFEMRYSEDYLWNKALSMATIGSRVLMFDENNNESLKAIHFSAKIYETLAYTSDRYDTEYCKILSSISYDISGYHANALCLIKSIYLLDDQHINENYVLENIQLFMLRKLRKLSEVSSQTDKQGILKRMNVLFYEISSFFLEGKNFNDIEELTAYDNDVINEINSLYISFMNTGNVMLSHFIILFRTKYVQLTRRSIWHLLHRYNKIPNKLWERYAKILTNNMFSDGKIIKEHDRVSIIEFWKSQINALEKGILNKRENYIIQMPTSAGKTFVAEMIILNNLIEYPGKKCIYIAPFKALVSQVEESLSDHIGRMGFVVSTIIGNYEIDIFDNLLINEADVLVATPEKIDLILRLNPEFFDNVSNITFDEGHVLGNVDSRSALMELLITRLRNRLKDMVSFNFISAVMPDISVNQLSEWLSIGKDSKINSKDINGDKWQPTRRLIGLFEWKNESGWLRYPELKVSDKEHAFVPNIIKSEKYETFNSQTKRINRIKYPSTKSKSDTASMLAYKFKENGPVLVFCAQPQFVRSVADSYISLKELKSFQLGVPQDKNKYKNLNSFEIALKILGEESDVVNYLEYGIGIHTGTMPQIVRRSIEDDYKNGKLELLVATNTLGQGVNLPIKTIIIHSVNINQSTRISNRDFWNIVGRAGRAGKETEGHVIYLCNSEYDIDLFSNYIDENKIEQVTSIFYQITKAICSKRISSEELSVILSNNIEPQLFALLVEEMVDTPDEDKIRQLIGNTLFKIQVESEDDLDDTLLIHSLANISKHFYNVATNKEKQIAYSRTAFSLNSCIIINDYITENFDMLHETVRNDIDKFISNILLLLRNIPEMHADKVRIDEICENEDVFEPLIRMWLGGVDINDMREIFAKNGLDPYNLLNEFIEIMFSYKYAWGVTSFNILFSYEMEKRELIDVDVLDYLSSFVKYGTTNIYSSWASSLGVPTRTGAKLIGNYYQEKYGESELKEFVKWFSNISIEELNSIFGIKVTHEQKAIMIIAQKININRYLDILENSEFEFYIMGIKYYQECMELAKHAAVNEKIKLIRDIFNEFDSSAIKVIFKEEFFGYVPREIAKVLSVQMDYNQKEFTGHISKIKISSEGYAIKIVVSAN